MSEYQRNVKMVQEAVDERCAALRPDPYLAQHVMFAAEREGGIAVRKKVSLGLVIALILMLLAATAVALVAWNGKDMVHRVLAPMVQDTSDETWSAEEINMILQMADKNGIELPKGIEGRIRQSNPVYKEELMRLLMKADYGESPALWPIEEQAWYDELLVQVGLRSERTRFIPGSGETSEEAALQTAASYASEKWSADLEDASTYRVYRQYMLTEDADGNSCKRWNIEFDMENGITYVISVTPDGQVDEYGFATYMHTSQTPQKVEEKLPGDIWELAALMRKDTFYTVETLAAFRSTYGGLIA